MKCVHCGNPAAYRCNEGDQEYFICLKCRALEAQIEANEFAQTASLLNFTLGQFEQATGGITGPLPRMKIPQAPPSLFDTLNVGNVSVQNSNVGVINTGTIKSIESAVGKLSREGDGEIATAIGELLNAVQNSDSTPPANRNAMADLLSTIAEEASKPSEDRRLTTVRTCALEFSTLVGGIAGMSQLWQQHGPTIISFFGL